ncbi:hypothetical protein RFI_09562, partial [Reticulomyxa filosa]
SLLINPTDLKGQLPKLINHFYQILHYISLIKSSMINDHGNASSSSSSSSSSKSTSIIITNDEILNFLQTFGINLARSSIVSYVTFMTHALLINKSLEQQNEIVYSIKLPCIPNHNTHSEKNIHTFEPQNGAVSNDPSSEFIVSDHQLMNQLFQFLIEYFLTFCTTSELAPEKTFRWVDVPLDDIQRVLNEGKLQLFQTFKLVKYKDFVIGTTHIEELLERCHHYFDKKFHGFNFELEKIERNCGYTLPEGMSRLNNPRSLHYASGQTEIPPENLKQWIHDIQRRFSQWEKFVKALFPESKERTHTIIPQERIIAMFTKHFSEKE